MKNKKFRTIMILTFVLVLAVGMASCGSKKEESKETKDTSTKKTEERGDVEITNPNYMSYASTDDIKTDVASLGDDYSKYYTKYIQYKAPNGGYITIVAQDKVTDEQLLTAYNQLSFYLEDYGDYKKAEVANKMADNNAVLNMSNGADGDSKIPQAGLKGQPLYQNEVQTVGGKWYINNDYKHRDAAFEEILHMVHDKGMGTKNSKGALPELQKEIETAAYAALPSDKSQWGKSGLWGLGSKDWLVELDKEGSIEQEYLAAVIDSYYGLWDPYTEGTGGMWGLYVAKNRAEVESKDPAGFAIAQKLFSPYLTYMARIDETFEGTFLMHLDSSQPYTMKSQYLLNAMLTGDKNSSIEGNDQGNVLMGNKGNNTLNGMEGEDVAQFKGNAADYTITKSGDNIIVKDNNKLDGEDTLISIETLRFADKDMAASQVQ